MRTHLIFASLGLLFFALPGWAQVAPIPPANTPEKVSFEAASPRKETPARRPKSPFGWDLTKRIYFPAERNGAKILPQRFEYSLGENESFLIGDALFDSSVFKSLLEKESSSQYKLTITWPAAILNEGEIHIKDSAGKTLWSSPIEPTSVEMRRSRTPEGHRSWFARASFQGIPVTTLERLQYYPFFQVCVQRRDGEMFVALCSKDLALAVAEDKTLSLRDQTGLREESVVEINGQEVDAQGAIFLNNETDLIFLRSIFKSGASVEIQTSMKQVQFIDFQPGSKPGMMRIQGQGAVPADPRGIRRIGPTTWEGAISARSPSLFLRAEGGIPLKQEFIFNGEGRPSDLRIELVGLQSSGRDDFTNGLAGAEAWTYELKSNQSYRIEGFEKDSKVEYSGEKIFWTVSSLEKDQHNTRYLRIKTPKQDTIGAFNVFRQRTREVSLKATYPGGLISHVRLDPLHSWYSVWGTMKNPLAKAKVSDFFLHQISFGASIHPRWISEEYMIPPWQIGLQYSFFSNDTQDFSTISALFETSFYLPRILSWLGRSGTLRAEHNPGGGSLPIKMKSSTQFELELRPQGPMGWSYGVFSHSYAFDPNKRTGDIQRTGLMLGYYYAF